MVTCVVVQQQLRLFRDGLGQLLDAEDDIEVVGLACTADDLVELCAQWSPHVVVMETDPGRWDVAGLVAALRRACPTVHLVGLAGQTPRPADVMRARRGGMTTVVARDAGVSEILGAIRNGRHVRPMRNGAAPAALYTRLPRRSSEPQLTTRELAVLNLVGSGWTSKEISGRLDISHKTVENHKQRIFRKLGVQNQAHAVSVALKAGLLRSDRVIG